MEIDDRHQESMDPARAARRRAMRSLALTAASVGAATAGIGWPARQAQAQGATYPLPGKPVRIVVPFPAGSGSDVTARLLAKEMSALMDGHPVIVDNKPGAATFIGAQEVARAAPDGHTLLYTIVVTHTQNPHLYTKLPYDPFKDFTPLVQVVKSATVLIAPPNAPFNNVAELIAYAKKHPKELNFASYSPGSTSHLNAEILMRSAGIEMVHVPYKGTADATRALYAGEVQLYFDGTATAVQAIQSGKAKGIGAATPTRVSVLPNLPTMVEQGVAGLDIVGWQSIFGPGHMAPALADKVADVVSRAALGPEMKKLIALQGNETSGIKGAAFAAIVKQDYDRWGAVIRQAGIRLEQ